MADPLAVAVWFCAITQVILVIIVLICLVYRYKKSNSVCVLVLGDIGRSPRMQYHSLSLANSGFKVDLVGFSGSQPIKEIIDQKDISILYLPEAPKKVPGMPQLIFYFYKTLIQSLQLLICMLFNLKKSSHIIIQNPPCIPSLAVSWLVCCMKGSSLVVDWHNYGYTILALNLKSEKHPLVRFAKWYEGCFGKLADINFCVTRAMQRDLQSQWNIGASVLYDRPASRYVETPLEERHKLFEKLSKDYEAFAEQRELREEGSSYTTFTCSKSDGSVELRKDRPVLIVSSTSWTEDEDFSVLLAALDTYESHKEINDDLPSIVCVITGKGPLKDYYKNLINNKNFKYIKVVTPWLTAEDYPKMIGSADFGVCLHTSSSGLDLPMKVVDMFGCGIPVCAISFNCLDELVKHGENGLVFHNATELSMQMEDMLLEFPSHGEKLERFRENLKTFQKTRWDSEWNSIVLPQLKQEAVTK